MEVKARAGDNVESLDRNVLRDVEKIENLDSQPDKLIDGQTVGWIHRQPDRQIDTQAEKYSKN